MPRTDRDKPHSLKLRLRRYSLPDDWIVLVGENDQDNDLLTFRVAEAKDWWFHIRGHPGSHVILRSRDDQEPGREAIRAAAAIAAYHSKARKGGRVAVVYARAADIRKPRGAPPGTVTLRNEQLVRVHPNIPEEGSSTEWISV